MAENIRGELDTLDENAGFITLALASLPAEVRTKSNYPAKWQHTQTAGGALPSGIPRYQWAETGIVYAHMYA